MIGPRSSASLRIRLPIIPVAPKTAILAIDVSLTQRPASVVERCRANSVSGRPGRGPSRDQPRGIDLMSW